MTAEKGVLCHCGRPLHYTDLEVKAAVERVVELKGDYISVKVGGRTWRVQRHYIALHGLKAAELPGLGFEESQRQPDDPLDLGAFVEKINSEPGDAHQDGARARVLGIFGQMPADAKVHPGVWAYMVEWDDFPGVPVGIMGTRIREVV